MTGIDLNFNDATQLIKQSNEQITKMYLDNIGKSVNDDNSDFIQKLNERTKEYINIIGPLNSEIFDIRTDSNTLYETYLSTKSSLNEIQTKLDNLDKENGTLKIAIEDKNNQIEYLQTELNKKNTENAKLIETNQSTTGDLKSEIYKLFTELEERRSRDGEIKGIETERTQMINDIGSFEVQIYELQTQLNNTQNQNSLLLKQISEIREEKETQKNQFLYEIEKERTKSIETENLKWKIESLIKEKEIILQRIASDKEVREAIEQLKTENENLKTQKINLEKQLQISRIEHKQLTNSISNSENIEIRRLEDEKLELLSRISVLESQIQLKSVKQKDAEMALLEKQLQQKQKEFNELQNNFSNLQTENLKLTKEIEKNKEEINQSDLKCSELEYQLEKSQNKEQETILKNEIERLQNEINVFDLKHEQIQHELESSQKENEELHQKINIHIENEKTLHEMLSNTQLQTTQSDTTNIINRAQIIKLNQKISELEAIIRSLQSNKEELLNTISENNIRHKHELDILSQSIQSVDNNKAQIEIVTTLNTKIIDLTNKSKQYLSQYQNESADHYNTKQNLIKSEANYSELSQRYRNIECDYSCLIESLTKLFKCMPSTSSIITAATRASKTCESYNNIIENNKKLENELRKANQMPNFLNYRLKQTEFCLELERKKCDVLNLKLNSSKTQKQNLTFAADFLLNVIEKASDKNIKSMASILLSKVDTNDGSDSELWNEFASMLLTPKVDVKQVEGLLRIKIEEKLQIMNRIMEKIQKLDNNFNDVKSKIGFYKAKKEHKKKIISKYKPPSTPKNIGSLYERSLKPRTPLPVHNDLEGTPFQNRKPFRVPLTAIKSSYENTDYSNNALGKKSSLKLPKHNSPYGVNPIPARSYY
ncbi:early endosome antigen 1 [Histomonas meleagridis]|uniref:early endosome antigen 1 n=1 Tax=Histomonas meleagridis TaxID=135588 RepID=UPI0035596202|nr:early endosome antigen 1 [Histomonas meleagridis]KAH0805239.1 early endosome antigen 1 [Histomonas meleagridis]